VGRGRGTTIKELTELLLRLTGSKLPIAYEPAGLTFVTNRIGCAKRAERDLGYRWTIDLKEGLESLIAWRRQHAAALNRKRAATGGVKAA
jgi:UDP-glucose 4-epimerase